MTDQPKTINGVPADQWGTWCAHNIRIVEPDPTDTDPDYPRGRIVDPWPCAAGCTREQVERDCAEGAAEANREAWDTYRAMVGA